MERVELQPFAADERLPELELDEVPNDFRRVAEQINRLRDELDSLLFGFQDYSIIGIKPHH